jgi:hypothetical protein
MQKRELLRLMSRVFSARQTELIPFPPSRKSV